MALCQSVDDHRTGHRGGWANEQRCKVLLDPGEGTRVCLFSSRVIVEDADRRYGVVGCINHIVSHEAFDIADDRNGALLDSARELFGHASPGFTLTNGGVHRTLLHRRGCPRSRLRRSSITPGGASSRIPRAPNVTPSSVIAPPGPNAIFRDGMSAGGHCSDSPEHIPGVR